jgi:hypothetical protein
MKKKEKFEYSDEFKEHLINQLGRLVEQMEIMNNHLRYISVDIEKIRIEGRPI